MTQRPVTTRQADAAPLLLGDETMNAWLLTSTFYGTWLPGDERGFVSRVRDHRWDEAPQLRRAEHDQYGESFDADLAGLRQHAKQSMRGPSIRINHEQAKVLLAQFQETAQYRKWALHAVAIMAEHVHWVVVLPETCHGSTGLRDFKSYGSRALTQRFGLPKSETWWTSKGSNRWLPDEDALRAAIEYVRNQQYPLTLWINPTSVF